MGSEYDIRCSKSCTRAGVTILVLAALAIAFLRPLGNTQELQDILTYTSLRVNMKDQLNRLESDPAWNHLKNKMGQPLEAWSIATLLEYRAKFRYPDDFSGQTRRKEQRHKSRNRRRKPKKLDPPCLRQLRKRRHKAKNRGRFCPRRLRQTYMFRRRSLKSRYDQFTLSPIL
jgi:hypothetical protein